MEISTFDFKLRRLGLSKVYTMALRKQFEQKATSVKALSMVDIYWGPDKKVVFEYVVKGETDRKRLELVADSKRKNTITKYVAFIREGDNLTPHLVSYLFDSFDEAAKYSDHVSFVKSVNIEY